MNFTLVNRVFTIFHFVLPACRLLLYLDQELELIIV